MIFYLKNPIPQNRNREIFESDHMVHSSYARELAPEVMYTLSCFLKLQPLKFFNAFIQLMKKNSQLNNKNKGSFKSLNTFSENLNYQKYTSF